jgi:hypothetical protein
MITLRVNQVVINPTLSFQIAASVPSVTVQDQTRSGTNFLEGDTIKVTVTSGFKSAPVTYNLSVNGVPQGTGISAGTTDGTGTYTSTGTLGSGLDGNWIETWFVGGVATAQVSFRVVSLPLITGPSGSSSVLFWYLRRRANLLFGYQPRQSV